MNVDQLPSLSVVIPVFNGASFIREALESVFIQSRPADEILVIDDGSTDETVSILQSFGGRIRILKTSHRGADAARNEGIASVNSEVVIFFDADDLMMPRRLELQGRAFQQEPETDFVFGHLVEFEGTAPQLAQPAWDFRRKPGLCVGTLAARKTALVATGPFETQWKVAGFMEWYFRVQDAGLKMRMLNEVILCRRIHGGNLTSRESAALALEYAQVIKRRQDRRRGSLS